ncbi:MAG TPA: GntR family transcriptional regulator [Candidatus Limnocylindria bacterium]
MERRGTASPQIDVERLTDLTHEFQAAGLSVKESALETIRWAILRGVLAPSTRLRQEDLAAILGTSRIPIREALRILEYEGLVESEAHRGSVVRALEASEIEEIYELRTVLECHAVRVLIPLLTDVDLADIERAYVDMADATDPDRHLILREQFYLRLYSVASRPRLVGQIARLRLEVARALRWRLIQHSPTHHQIFYEAIRDGDAERATAELASHYRKVTALLRRFLRDGEPQRDPPIGGRSSAIPHPEVT